MAEQLLLVHSPLVGPMTWQPVADRLRERGSQVSCPDLTNSLAEPPPYWRRQCEAIARAAGSGPVILVGHSAAGPLLPAAGERMEQVAGYVFADARLPHPGLSWFQTAPADRAQQLRARELKGWLPPWPEWWPPEVLVQLVPDPEVRARFVADCPRLPLALFEEAQPVVFGWPDAPCGYLRLSSGYGEQAAQSRNLGWPVIGLESRHLGMLTDPDTISLAILELIGRLRQ